MHYFISATHYSQNICILTQILQSRAGPSSTLGFHPAMPMPFAPMHLPQPGLIQAGLAGMGPSPDELRRSLTSHLTSMSGRYKEPNSQVTSSHVLIFSFTHTHNLSVHLVVYINILCSLLHNTDISNT